MCLPGSTADSMPLVFDFQGNVRCYEWNGKYGLRDRMGVVLAPAIFETLDPFFNNVALVWVNGKGGVINKQGKYMVDPIWDTIELSGEFARDHLLIVSRDGKFGCINLQSDMVIPLVWDNLSGFINGAAVIENGLYEGVISSTGQILCTPVWDWAYYPYDSYITVNKDSSWGLIGYQNKLLTSSLFEYAGIFAQGRVLVMYNGLLGIIDTAGNLISNYQWIDAAHGYQEGYLAVKKDGLWGYIDLKGYLVLPLQYEEAYSFSNELALIKMNSLYGYIDKEGRIVIACQYIEASDFQQRYAAVKTNKGYQFIDRKGVPITSDYYDEYHLFSEGLAAVLKDGLWGYIDVVGHLSIPFQYMYTYSFRNNVAIVGKMIEGSIREFYINRSGKIITPFINELVIHLEEF